MASIDLDAPVSQEAFGRLVGVTQQAISMAVADGTLKDGETCAVWLQAYCSRLRGVAAGRTSEESLALTRANTALADAKYTGQAIKNAILLKQYAPIALLTEVLASAAEAVATRLDALIPTMMRSGFPLDDAARTFLAGQVAAARNEWVERATEIALLDLVNDDDGSSDAAEADDADPVSAVIHPG